MISIGQAGTKHKFDTKAYDNIAQKVIGAVISGSINVDKLLADVETLVEMGVAGCKEHMGEPETPKVEKELMQVTIDSAEKMSLLTLEEIEELWHDGGAAKKAGINIDKFDHFDEVMCHYDAVVHPATCIICLNEYKKDKNDEHLEQIQAELQEVREHLKHLE